MITVYRYTSEDYNCPRINDRMQISEVYQTMSHILHNGHSQSSLNEVKVMFPVEIYIRYTFVHL